MIVLIGFIHFDQVLRASMAWRVKGETLSAKSIETEFGLQESELVGLPFQTRVIFGNPYRVYIREDVKQVYLRKLAAAKEPLKGEEESKPHVSQEEEGGEKRKKKSGKSSKRKPQDDDDEDYEEHVVDDEPVITKKQRTKAPAIDKKELAALKKSWYVES